jgi:hypothetical protein
MCNTIRSTVGSESAVWLCQCFAASPKRWRAIPAMKQLLVMLPQYACQCVVSSESCRHVMSSIRVGPVACGFAYASRCHFATFQLSVYEPFSGCNQICCFPSLLSTSATPGCPFSLHSCSNCEVLLLASKPTCNMGLVIDLHANDWKAMATSEDIRPK